MRIYNSTAEQQSATSEFAQSTTNVAFDTSIKRSGSASWKFISTFGASAEFSAFITADDVLFSRIAVYFTSFPSSGSSMLLWHISSSSGSTIASINIASTGKLQLRDGANAGSQVGSDSATLSTNTWYIVELMTNNGGSPEMDARLNLTSFASGSMTAANNAARIGFGLKDSVTATVYVDDIAVNSATNFSGSGGSSGQNSWVGDTKLLMLRPNAAGDANLFGTQVGGTAGSANNYTRVNETTPDDATTYNGSNTNADEDMFNVDNSGIGTSDTVNSVTIYGRRRESAAGTGPQFRLQIRKTASGTTGVPDPSTTVNTTTSTAWGTVGHGSQNTYHHTFYNDPDGSAWTKSTLDSMQIGYKLNTGTTNRADFTAVWAIVDYTVFVPKQTHTTSAVIRKANTLPHTTDSLKRKANVITHTTSANKRLTTVKTHTADALKLKSSSTMSDNFNDNSIDSTKWTQFSGATEQNQHLEIISATTSSYRGFTSVPQFNLTGSYGHIEVVDAGNQSIPSLELYPLQWLQTGSPSSNALWWYISGNTVAAYKKVAGSQTQIFSAAYTNATYRWLRIREASGTVYWDSSVDGVTWTNRASQLVSALFNVTNVYQEITVGTYSAETLTTTVKFDNYNIIQQLTTHTTDALKRKVSTLSHTTSSVNRVASVKTHTTGSNKKKTTTITHTTNSLKRKSTPISHTTDALKRTILNRVHTTDSNKKSAGKTRSHTTDSFKRITATRTHTADADKRKTTLTTHTTDSNIWDRRKYSRENKVTLPTTNTTLATVATTTEANTMSADDSTYVDISGNNYLIHQFEYTHVNSTEAVTLTWNGQSTTAPSAKTVYLQIWNYTTSAWETLTSNSVTAANTDFTLTALKKISMSDYYSSNVVRFRIYQGIT